MGDIAQSIEPRLARLPPIVLQCIWCIGRYTGTQKTADFSGFVSLCIAGLRGYTAIYPRLFPTQTGYLTGFK